MFKDEEISGQSKNQGGKNQFHEYLCNYFNLFQNINQFSDWLDWNQSSNILKLQQCSLQRIHLPDTGACSKQFFSNQHVTVDCFS
jgi:hypothetical protein